MTYELQSTHKWALPRDDINAPDLYIPLTAFASYILLVGLAKGVGGAGFTPELLIQTVWRCLFLQLVETAIVFILVGLKHISPPFLDIFAYTGYKYVGLCLNVVARLMGFYFHLFVSLFISAMLGIFVIKSFRAVVPKTATAGPPGLYVQLACGLLQAAVVCILCFL